MKTNIELHSCISRNEENHLANQVGDELILLNLETGDYLGLNSVGAAIWEKLASTTTPASIVDELMGEFEVERNACVSQTVQYLDKMAALGLLKIQS